jgi:CoA:oxalate CoA-transferase
MSPSNRATCSHRPLEGFTVLGVEQYISGPYATMILGDLGAEVIKIEHPQSGDPRRAYPPVLEGKESSLGVPFLLYNRNKRSVTIDLKTNEGRAIFLGLVKKADAVVENFRPGAADRLGVGYEACRSAQPKIVYGAISGFGRMPGYLGPLSNDACFDPVAQAMGGIMDLTGTPDGPPIFPMVGLADLHSGLLTALGVTAALLGRERTGLGQFVDIAMYDAIASLIERPIALYGLTGLQMKRGPDPVVPIAAFKVANGYVALTAPSEEMWRRLCTAINREDLLTDWRFVSQVDRPIAFHGEFKEIFESWGSTRDVQDVCRQLRKHGVPVGPVQTVADLYECDQLAARQMIVPMELPKVERTASVARTPILFSDSEPRRPSAPPDLGADTEFILKRMLDIDNNRYEKLKAAGVV